MEYVAYRIDRLTDSIVVTRKRDGKGITVPFDHWEYLRTEVCFTELKTILFLFHAR